MLQFGFSSPGRLLSCLKHSTLHSGQQGGVYVTRRVGGMQTKPNFCFSTAWKAAVKAETKTVAGHTLKGWQRPQGPWQAPALPPPCPCTSVENRLPGFPQLAAAPIL